MWYSEISNICPRRWLSASALMIYAVGILNRDQEPIGKYQSAIYGFVLGALLRLPSNDTASNNYGC